MLIPACLHTHARLHRELLTKAPRVEDPQTEVAQCVLQDHHCCAPAEPLNPHRHLPHDGHPRVVSQLAACCLPER